MIVKVKIINCSEPLLWYRNYVGEEFECQKVKSMLFANLPFHIFEKHVGFGHHIKNGDYIVI